ncbi:MAG: spermidine/putrescine ABC transporter substrate-binding protein [Parachlamydia sp.]|jgi:spermidine/putrescine transport system substrate-binding protein|nr:spermidine/putrescine ABC transporter substrate-binding protein [Parachlamydia sp.]
MQNLAFFKGVALLCGMILFSSCQNSSQPQLNLLIWSDYVKPEIIEAFEEKCHCRVVIDTFDSNESMYAKLKLGAEGYDVIFPSNYFVDIMSRQDMLQPLDHGSLPNLKNLDPQYVQRAGDALLKYGVPYMVSSAGVAYREDKVKNFEPSWGIFSRPEYKGRMTMLNDVRETIGEALIYLGYSANTTNPGEIDEATQLLIEWKKNLSKFESEQYKAGIASAEYLVVNGYNGDILQVMNENPAVQFVYPKEGVTFSMDFMVIPKTAPHPELGLEFINFMLDGEVAAENMAFSLFFTPNQAAYDKLPENLRNNQILFMPKEIFEKSEMIKNLGEAGFLYNKAWDKIKAS